MADETGNTDTNTGNTDTVLKPNLGKQVQQATKVISKQPGLKTTTSVARMDWGDAESLANELKVGFRTTSKVNFTEGGMLAGLTATRQNGGYGTVELTITEVEETEIWNLDFLEIQKPILNWHFGQEDGPDIPLLRKWQRLETVDGAWDAYNNFLTEVGDESSKLTGDTLKLAEKILKGVEYYSVYTPVLTRISTYNDLSKVSDVGASIGTIGPPKGSGESIGDNNLATLTKLATQWLKTKDSLQGAIDGTFQRVEQWTGADKWDEDLYETENSGTKDAS